MTRKNDGDDDRSALIDRLVMANLAFLFPYVEKRMLAALAPEFAPRAPEHLEFAWRRGALHPERCIMAFLRADAEMAVLGDVLDAWIEIDGSTYVVNPGHLLEQRYDADDLVSYLSFNACHHILNAWLRQLDASKRIREELGEPALSVAMLDDAMMPTERDAFDVIFGMGFYDPDVAIEVLREARTALPNGLVVPRFAAKVFLVDTDSRSLS